MKGGKLLLETGVDNSKLEKQLDQLEKEITRLKEKKIKLDLDETKAMNNLQKVDNKIKLIQQQIDTLEANNTPNNLVENLDYQKLISQREELNAKGEEYLQQLDAIKDKQSDINQSLSANETSVEIIKNQLKGINLHVGDNLKQGFDKLYKSAKKLAMGIIGVRAAYSLVRKMASSYLADNEKTAQRIDNLWTGLGTLMSGIIEGIIDLLKKAITAMLYFVSVLTQVNYVAKANEALLRKRAKAIAKLRKEQNKLNASFDEAETLSKASSSDSSGYTGPVELFDVEELGNAKKVIEDLGVALRPVWEVIKGIIDFAKDHPDVILTILGGSALLSMLTKIIGVAGAGKVIGTGLTGILGALTTLMAIGAITISIIVASNIKEESAEFSKFLDKMNTDGNKIHDDFIKKETEIDNIIKNSNIKRKNSLDLLNEAHKAYILFGPLVKDTYDTALNTAKDTSIALSQNIAKEIKLWEESGKTEEQQRKIRDDIYEAYNYNISVINALKKQGKDTSELEKINKNLVLQYVNMSGAITDANGKLKLLKKDSNINIKVDLDTKSAEKKAKTLLEAILSGPMTLAQWLGGKISKGMQGAKGAVYYPSTPKLALGGIVNMPGKGVPYHGAVIGERGAEAVLPLTDSQQMELLGATIGKYIKVNLTNVTELDGRTIARKVQEVGENTNFLMNR